MVSFEAATRYLGMVKIKDPAKEFEDSSRKRKQQDHHLHGEYHSSIQLEKRSKTDNTKSLCNVELQLETPLPSEWQRCLDVKSGQIHFFNTRTQRRMFEDPSGSPEPESPTAYNTSLDLELNLLPCDSVRKHGAKNQSSKPNDIFNDLNQNHQKNNISVLSLSCSPSWLAFDGDDDQGEQQEMVATVCMRCHMLVMLCKSLPACPSCKFMHTPEQSSPKLFKPSRLSLLC